MSYFKGNKMQFQAILILFITNVENGHHYIEDKIAFIDLC